MRAGAIAGFLAAALVAASPALAKPARIVSLNLCGDQYVVRLAERSRIVSLSRLATDPEMSAVAAEAAGIPRNFGRAEDVLALAPDLVVAGTYRTGATVALIRRLGIPVLEIGIAETVEAVAAETRRVAAALGETEKGEAWIAEMEAELARPRPSRVRPRAAFWDDNGFSLGRGTLMDELMARAGLANVAAEDGLVGYGRLPLERLVLSRPDMLLVSGSAEGRPSRAREILGHPALKAVMAGRARVEVPAPLTACATPDIGRVVPLLAGAVP
jgi:iron complex transport system substrate-binding protein